MDARTTKKKKTEPFRHMDWPADKVERRKLDTLIEYARNPRLHSEAQVAQIARSITEYGWTFPVLVDESGLLIAGHGRVLAARQLGLREVPVMVASGWSEEQKRSYRIADNALTLAGDWDKELLATELGDLKLAEFDLTLTGFDQTQLVSFLGSNEEVDAAAEEVPELLEESISRLGDLWILGKHRLLCGDSTNAKHVAALMNGERATLFATDPPYAVGYSGGSHPATRANRGKANRNKNWIQYAEAGDAAFENEGAEEAEAFYSSFVKAAVECAIKIDAPWYCWHASRNQAMVEKVWNEHGAFVHQQIIWVKTRAVLTYAFYMWQHEPCLFGWIKGHKPSPRRMRGETPSTVWQVPNAEIESAEHPTSKPTRLFGLPIDLHTKVGEICYEPFSGSGSQIIAAEKLERRCFAIEISPNFVDVAVRRWEQFTGEKAVLNGRRGFDAVAKARHSGKSISRPHEGTDRKKRAVRSRGNAGLAVAE